MPPLLLTWEAQGPHCSPLLTHSTCGLPPAAPQGHHDSAVKPPSPPQVEPTVQTLNSTLTQAAGSGSMQPILDVLLAAGQCHASLTASTLAAVRRATTALGGDRQLAHVLSSLPSGLFK